MAKSKLVSLEEASKHFFDGMTILIPGFGGIGVPNTLIRGIDEAGTKDLTIISNNSGTMGKGIGLLIHKDVVKKITCSHIGRNTETQEKTVAGDINITFIPQGTLCEKVRAGGAGIGGILTGSGVHTPVEDGKQLLEWDKELGEFKFVKSDDPQNGPRYILELPIHADVAIIHAYKADKMGNLQFNKSAKNFNQVFATAADFVIAEAENIVEVGEIEPDDVDTPGALVDLVVRA